MREILLQLFLHNDMLCIILYDLCRIDEQLCELHGEFVSIAYELTRNREAIQLHAFDEPNTNAKTTNAAKESIC